MNRTKEILLKIKSAVETGQMTPEATPLEDIIECVKNELELNRHTFLESQYDDVMESFGRIAETAEGMTPDRDRLLLLINSLILCVDMINSAMDNLANEDYWTYKHIDDIDDPEVYEVINYIDKNRRISLINYDFVDEYKDISIDVYADEEGWLFVPYRNRRMYFPKSWSGDKIVNYLRILFMEQDERSPHCYRMDNYGVEEGDIVLDAGAAEGIFTLDVIDKAAKVYIVEADEEWYEALQRTFLADGEKVELIYGFLDKESDGLRICIDDLFEGKELNYIKMDIEGYEKPALEGAREVLSVSKNLRCAICTYHCKEDEAWIGMYLQGFGFCTTTSRGYMCPDWTVNAYLDAELRRGVMFGNKMICEKDSVNESHKKEKGDFSYDALIMVTARDYGRLQNHYGRLLDTMPVRRLLFVGSEEVGRLVAESNLGDRVGFINEDTILPFDRVHEVMKDALRDIVTGELPRGITGWYYQQFLKMQYSSLCEDEYYMVWDGDTVPCAPFTMFKDGEIPYLDLKTEFHEEYFVTLEKLLPGMHKCIEKSFIAEHMLIKKDIMQNMIGDIENNDVINGTEFWEKIIRAISPDKLQDNSFSEFETYGTYVAFRYPNTYRLRNWHSFRYGGEFFDPNKIDETDFAWLDKDFFAISFEKGHFIREDHANLFDNKEYQAKLSARKMLEIAQEEFGEGSYQEKWD